MIRVIGRTDPPSDKSINVGQGSIDTTLILNLSDRHEAAYYGSFSGGKKVLDHIIAQEFIHRGDVVVDVGANIGFCSLVYLLNGASKVYAFEPHPDIFARLKSVASDNLIVSELALSDTVGTSELIISSAHNQGHTLKKSWADLCTNVFGDNPGTRVIQTSTLDVVMGDTEIDFLKIDIEGVEVEFLNGAKNILTNHRPKIIHIEIYPQVLDATVDILKKYYTTIKRCVITKDQKVELVGVSANLAGMNIDRNHPPTFICF